MRCGLSHQGRKMAWLVDVEEASNRVHTGLYFAAVTVGLHSFVWAPVEPSAVLQYLTSACTFH